MNGRVFDPATAHFLSPDNYVQAPGFTQSYNRYAYCLNNPLKYTDPSGNKWWHWAIADVLTGGAISFTAAATVSMFGPIMSNQGYEAQKYVSPVAVKLNFSSGSIQNGIGFDVSLGMNKGAFGYRFNYGATYYWSSYGGYNGWEERKGGELEILPFVNYSGTTFTPTWRKSATCAPNNLNFCTEMNYLKYRVVYFFWGMSRKIFLSTV